MIVDESMQSLLDYGKPDFPFAFYRDEAELLAELSISWHWHNSFEFSYVSRGTLLCEISGEAVRLSQGDAIFLNSGVLHCFTIRGSSALENVLFAPEFVAPKDSRVYLTCVLPYLRSDLPYQVFRAQEARDRAPLARIVACCAAAQATDAGSAIDVLAKVLALWNEFTRRCEPGAGRSAEHIVSLTQSRTRKMLYYIYTHAQEKIGLREIAESAGISQREALRCFSESVHDTPVRFLNTHRLNCAEQLLRTGQQSISEIAAETGYDNAGYFCKVFKKAYGSSPLQYRKAQQRAEAERRADQAGNDRAL